MAVYKAKCLIDTASDTDSYSNYLMVNSNYTLYIFKVFLLQWQQNLLKLQRVILRILLIGLPEYLLEYLLEALFNSFFKGFINEHYQIAIIIIATIVNNKISISIIIEFLLRLLLDLFIWVIRILYFDSY